MGTSFQLRVWVPPDSPVFPLVKVSPSTVSATRPWVLFDRFLGTMTLSDFL
jgi:hypothetical protein